MPRYIASFRLAPPYFQGILKDPSDREEFMRPLYARFGAALEHLYFSPDTMEGFQIWTCEDPARLDGALLAALAAGMSDVSTWSVRRILTGAELAEAARAADPSIYRPPGA